MFETGDFCFLSILLFDGDGVWFLFDDPDCLCEFEVESHFGGGEDVVAGDDENFVTGLLQVGDVFGCVLL